MNNGRLTARQMAIKAAFRDLIEAAGGQKRVAAITRACQSSISKQSSPHDGDHFPTVDVIADLEADTGLRAITTLLADMAGCDVVPRAGTVKPESMMADAGRMALAFGDLQHKFMAAIADGHLDPVEQAQVRGAIKDLRDRINTFDAQTATATTVRAVK